MEGDIDEEPATAEVLRTKNEAEEQYKKPDIAITEGMKITELGNVENIVDNLIVVRANISGEYQVLESGSLLCLGDRSVVGVVADTIGRVHAPLYSVGFPDPADVATMGIAKGTTIFYVDEHSTFVFTKPLKAIKGTDASNVHDEETNDVEFSDDEAEAEYKRGLKRAKLARADSRREAEAEHDRPVRRDSPPANPMAAQQHQGGGLNYSDEDEDMGMYKPLTRPDHFEDIVGAGAPIEDRSHVRRNGPGRLNRGRGDRGHGGHGRGGRGDHRSPGRGRDRQRNRGVGGQRQQPPQQQQRQQQPPHAPQNQQNRPQPQQNQQGRQQQQQNQQGRQQQPQSQRQHQQQQQGRNRPADNFSGGNRSGPSRSPADKHRRPNRRERNRTSGSPMQQRNHPPNARQRSPPRGPRAAAASSPGSSQPYSAPPTSSYSTASYTNPQAFAWNQNSLPVSAAQTTQHAPYPQFSQGPPNPSASIPVGAFVNPHFQPQQPQASVPAPAYSFQNPWQVPQQQAPQQQAAAQPNWAALAQLFQAAQQNQMPSQPQQSHTPTQDPRASYAPPAVNAQPQQDSQAAFRAAQQQLELLRALNRGQGQ
ncbi:NAF1-domain-containing protein [Mytilinidion resinicola]|uniref:H/ACA ribonucleoprotein complex non-core subunit NAF1 n=1 Tax=Mytilinidion resinicola TaxID=574789 RepID=A0A6A6XZG0_9PEZI|nr:NAF1-domain-containing protein [Mytilinidion resinicola]KAF2801951.1 NAF1-domain-containing protein [Mytilinidion resinicola]